MRHSRMVVDGTNQMGDMSCLSTSLCIADDTAGNVIMSSDPAAASPTWTVTKVESVNQLEAVTCATATQCLAVDSFGNVFVGTPAASRRSYRRLRLA